MTVIAKQPLRDQVRSRILDRVISGRIPPGERLNLATLARDMGISPTPVREALTQLASEGFIRDEPNRGFFVLDLSMREAAELYPLIWTLESLAVRLQHTFPTAVIGKLRAINEKLGTDTINPERMVSLDRRWHTTLISGCGNALLLEQVSGLKLRANRYEHAYMQYSGRLPNSTTQHDVITEALASNQTSDAVRLLEEHWRTSLEFLSDWLNRQLA